MTRIAVIGAGMCGLTVAHLLQPHAEISVFEKARGVSGRMSTRRADPFHFDHGAQYFTARTKNFQDFLQPLLDAYYIDVWPAQYARLTSDPTKPDHPYCMTRQQDTTLRYVGVPGMNAVAKYLARDLSVTLNTRITRMTRDTHWTLYDEHDQPYSGFDWVICTAPAPQTAALLPQNFMHYHRVAQTDLQPCLSVMLGFDTPLTLPFDAAHVTDPDISWIAVNSSKPQRDAAYTLVAHSTPHYAQQHIDADRDDAHHYLCERISAIIGQDIQHATHNTMHAWRYAHQPQNDTSDWPVLLDTAQQLGACGDWCQAGRVEGAFTAASHFVTHLTPLISGQRS